MVSGCCVGCSLSACFLGKTVRVNIALLSGPTKFIEFFCALFLKELELHQLQWARGPAEAVLFVSRQKNMVVQGTPDWLLSSFAMACNGSECGSALAKKLKTEEVRQVNSDTLWKAWNVGGMCGFVMGVDDLKREFIVNI